MFGVLHVQDLYYISLIYDAFIAAKGVSQSSYEKEQDRKCFDGHEQDEFKFGLWKEGDSFVLKKKRKEIIFFFPLYSRKTLGEISTGKEAFKL